MKKTEAVEALKAKLEGAVIAESTFLGEITLEIPKERLREVLAFLKQAPNPGYETLMDLTAVDFTSPENCTKVVYWLHNPTNYERLRVACFVERLGNIPSIVDLWEGADWYERELYDLYGLKFDGHPDLKRILMPDDWKGHPLLKDYAFTEESVAFKHGVTPKVPSEIIPHVRKNH